MNQSAMRSAAHMILLVGLALCLARPVFAGPNEGGTVILHNANLTYENMNECGRGSVPATCSEAVTEIDGAGPSSYKVFKVYAAFPQGSMPRLRGITFGIRYTDFHSGQPGCYLVGYGPCAELELAMDGWPASNTGTSLVWDETQTTGLVECYWFAGYNYYGAATISLIPHPQQDGYFADDGIPSELDQIAGYGVLGFDQPGQLACPGPLVFGACCHPDGTCTIRSQTGCFHDGGNWLGGGTVCDPNPCPQPLGACCTVEGVCTMTTQADCAGTWMGWQSDCTPNPCPQPLGACCHPDGTCTTTLESACLPPNAWQGPLTVCFPNPCPQPLPGACCLGDGSCVLLNQYACTQQGGTWLGEGMACDPNPCPPPVGACCHSDGSCTMTTEACCTGEWLGWQSDCTPNPCPQPSGACCHQDGSCTMSTEAGCAYPNEWQGPGTTCTPNPCTAQPYGACCHPDGLCTMTYQNQCQPPNTWQGDGTSCDPNPCPQPPTGACCHPDASCTLTIEANCHYPNIWQGPDTVCEPNPCPIPSGACCIGLECTVTIQADCDGSWLGPNTDCDPNPCGCRSAGREQIIPPPPRSAGTTAQLGPIGSVTPSPSRTNPCPGSTLYQNSDGSYENAYAWQYGGNVPPFYGAFAEGYNAAGNVCGMQLMLTTLPGYYTGQTLDAYVWDAAGGNPNNILSATMGISIAPPAIWPNISTHDIDVSDAGVWGDFFVGFWGTWPNQISGWFVAADLDGFGGMPRTNIAPGIGYPSCWQDPSIVWGPTQAMGIDAYIGEGAPIPVKITSWGKIKNLYK